MFKKLLLCFAFLAQSQVIQALEYGDGLSEGFAPRKTALQVLQSTPRYLLDTIKSDFCIGDRVVQHNTVASQLLAGARLCAYTITPLLLYQMGMKFSLGMINPIRVPAEILNEIASKEFLKVAATVFVSTPALEETFCTILPQLLKKYSRRKIGNCSEIIPVAASLLFGFSHKDYSLGIKAYFVAISYTHHRYMKNRSCKTIAPFFAHALHNIFKTSSFISPFRSIKDALAVQILRIYAVRQGLTVPYEQILINLIRLNAIEDAS